LQRVYIEGHTVRKGQPVADIVPQRAISNNDEP